MMNIVAADDEKIALEGLVSSILEILPEAKVQGFQYGNEVLEFVECHQCDIAFLDIKMRGMDGISLAKKLKIINPQINIIFTTGYSEYASDAFELHASGYVMKPVTPDKIKNEIDNLRHPIPLSHKNKLTVKTFGNFECFIQGKPLEFHYNKTRELLAYLIDCNGSLCTNGEIVAVLWEDKVKTSSIYSYLRNLYADLIHTLEKYGCQDAIIKQRGRIGVDPKKIDCDYYDWLEGKVYAINAFKGEYMRQYSWSEFSLGVFDEDK